MDFNFKVPSTVPQDLLLIQDLIGSYPPPVVTDKHVSGPSDPNDHSIASTDSEAESEDEVEAGLTFRDDDSGASAVTSDSALPSDSELDASSSSDSDEGSKIVAPRRQKLPDDTEDEESAVAAPAAYFQSKNEIVESNIIIPTISEVEPCDTLEKVGEIMSIIGNIVVVRGLPMDHINPLSERALDAESLLVFGDRKVLGYIYETFGPTSQPLYQVKFNEHYPLDTDKVRLLREVFHVPQRSHFVFVNQLKKLRGSDASNIHDEEPAEDEVEFSDDEKEAAFRAQRKRRGQSLSSRQSTPARSRTHIGDMARDIYHGSNPYDAHGPYDDNYHFTEPPRPPPIPYDDPYADIPTSDARDSDLYPGVSVEGGELNHESGDGPKASHRRTFNRGARARGAQNHQSWSSTRRGRRHKATTSQRTFDSGPYQSHTAASRMIECARGYGPTGDATASQPPSNAWPSPAANNIQGYQQPFVQPHINPRFAAMFGLNLPSESAIPWDSQNAQDPTSLPHQWVGTWATHGGIGPEGEGDMYWPM